MTKRIISLLLFILFLVDPAWGQTQTYPESRMKRRADSVSLTIDSLIASQKLFHLVFENKYEGDAKLYYRHCYIDTLNWHLVKCILDTTFDDYYKRKFTQVVIYFNQGYEFKFCYNEKRGTSSGVCTLFNIYPEEDEIRQQTGQLDKKMKSYLTVEIYYMKFFQKKYSY